MTILSSLMVLIAAAPAVAATPTVTEFTGPQPNAQPLGIAAMGNDTLVFAEGARNDFGVSELNGFTYQVAGLSGAAAGVTEADGYAWLTEPAANRIARVNALGHVTEISLPEGGSQPTGITAGPDGNVWFTEAGGTARIGEVTNLSAVTPTITEYSAGLTANSQPTGIAAGSDGNLWFTETAAPGRIGEINPTTHAITEYPTPTTNSQPTSIAAGPDGNLWFTETAGPGRIGEIDPSTHAITEYPTPTTNSQPTSITAGPGGDLWFTEAANPGAIGWINPGGAISQIATKTSNSRPDGITQGPDGSIWFTEDGGTGKIGRLALPLPAAVTDPAIAVAATTATLTGTVNPNGFDTTYHFDWGTTSSYGRRVPIADVDAGAGALPAPVAQTLTGLTPGTTYHYRLVASDCGGCIAGTTDGPDMTFTTAAATTSTTNPGSTTAATPTSAPVPPPAMGHTAVAKVVSGTILVKVRGSQKLRPLAAGQNIPLGSLIDARKGRLNVTTEISHAGRMQTAAVWGGDFIIGQTGNRGMTTFRMPTNALDCPARGAHPSGDALHPQTVRAHRRKKTSPSLWAKDNHGRYSTRGHNSVATVRGTEWKTVESCRGTLTFVKRGVVSVLDLHTHHAVLVHAGHSFLARP